MQLTVERGPCGSILRRVVCISYENACVHEMLTTPNIID
jgi:hypothetical protein